MKLNAKINELNDILRDKCNIYGFNFVDNANIGRDHICSDNLHLNHYGLCRLANNFIGMLNYLGNNWQRKLIPNRGKYNFEEALECPFSDVTSTLSDFPNTCVSDYDTESNIDENLDKSFKTLSYDVEEKGVREKLFDLKIKVKDKLIIGNLNINSLPIKFEQLDFIVNKKIDIFVLTETKLDSTFPSNQFLCKVTQNLSALIEIGTGEE